MSIAPTKLALCCIAGVSCSGSAGTIDEGPSTGSNGSGGGAVTCPAVGLAGHEAQFHFRPTLHCDEFIAAIENRIAVVVGTDIVVNGEVYEGTHDCTLARDVRFHLSWGDGTSEWTEFLDCDVGRVVAHTYAAPGRYSLAFFAEDRDALATRCHESEVEVLAQAQDLTVSTSDALLEGDSLSFAERLENYGNLPASDVEIRYVSFDCRQELTLHTRRVSLGAGETVTSRQTLTLPTLQAGWIGVRIDADDEVAEACPMLDAHNNVSIAHTLTYCGTPMP